MFQTISRICVLAVGLMAIAAFADSATSVEPVPFKAVYKARFKGFPIGATGVRELTKQGDGSWLLTSRAHNFLGTITEQSSFVMGKDDRIMPTEYQYHRTGIGPNRTTVIKFNWETMRLSGTEGSKTWDAPLEPGTQDRLSYQYLLRSDLALARNNGDPAPALSYRIADSGEFTQYSFKIVGEEKLKTPIGTFKTVKATRTDGNPERITNFWLAPDYNYLLIRFEQTEPNGGGFELQLRHAELNGKDIKVTGD